MSTSFTANTAIVTTDDMQEPGVTPSSPSESILANIDVAVVLGSQLLVYGWLLGFPWNIQSAAIEVGPVVVDLTQDGISLRRPDVAKHFGLPPGDDRHGFFALIEFPATPGPVVQLKLLASLSRGQAGVSVWPVSCGDAQDVALLEPHAKVLHRLLPLLPKSQARRLVAFAEPLLGFTEQAGLLRPLPSLIRLGIDLCCLIEERLLIVSGWCADPFRELTRYNLVVGRSLFQLDRDGEWLARPDISPASSILGKDGPASNSGFLLVCFLNGIDAGSDEAVFEFGTSDAAERFSQPIIHTTDLAHRTLVDFIERIEPELGLAMIDCLGKASRRSGEYPSLNSLLGHLWRTTFERLPTSIQNTNPRYCLHVDQVIAIADQGIFLIGWFNAEGGISISVTLRCGHYEFCLNENWSRYDRPDVTAFLAATHIQAQNHRHGFSCFIPLPNLSDPCLVSIETGPYSFRQMKIPPPKKFESTLQSIRTIMSSFLPDAPDLKSRLDRHVGPAIHAAWKARPNPLFKETTRTYGLAPSAPVVSLIVPLYGRHDFAEYQLALFAGDPDFQNIELIYVVDDPGIFADFSAACSGLYGMYEIPFVVSSSGFNLGFSGANNFAATRARASHLLFLNSDVFPKNPGWVSQLIQTYRSLPNPGVLGARLLYEDGSLQHGGMAFRRHAEWSDLWINDHPGKGLSVQRRDGCQKIDAVTAACVLVENTLFHSIGGFSEDYIIGDFEDSDLCLRLLEAGRSNYISLETELYHLERQSQNKTGDSTWRNNLTLYNCWLFNKRWSNWIEAREQVKHSCSR